jgi:hypothetical protein
MKTKRCYCGTNIKLDDENFEKVLELSNWHCNSGCIRHSVKEKPPIKLTSFLFGEPPDGFVWDHKDRDPHNAQKAKQSE